MVVNKNKFVVSEYVSFGHPDKIADQIADALTDEYINGDKNSRCGIEVLVKDNIVVLGGEVHSNAKVDYDAIVRKVFDKLHFSLEHHLTPDEIKIVNLIGQQSKEIHNGVDKDETVNAGDQGFMVGFASNETPTFMPLGHYIAKTICNSVANDHGFGPDTKSQVIVEYDENGKAVGIQSILVSTMHMSLVEVGVVRIFVKDAIEKNKVGLDNMIYEKFIKDKDIKIDVNPCGSWNIGGPVSDCGVTGRKLVVDAYGGYCNIGGGNYSGKDLSKVDRSGAYMCRYLAKNIVATGLFNTAKVTISYTIGVAEPSSLEIEVSNNKDLVGSLKKWILNNVDLTPGAFIKKFTGGGNQYYECSRYGHYGFEGSNVRPWEHIDIAWKIQEFLTAKCQN